MIIVVSDLHLMDGSAGAHHVDAGVFRSTFTDLAAHAREAQARDIKLVFLGDVFDLIRSERWFGFGLRRAALGKGALGGGRDLDHGRRRRRERGDVRAPVRLAGRPVRLPRRAGARLRARATTTGSATSTRCSAGRRARAARHSPERRAVRALLPRRRPRRLRAARPGVGQLQLRGQRRACASTRSPASRSPTT